MLPHPPHHERTAAAVVMPPVDTSVAIEGPEEGGYMMGLGRKCEPNSNCKFTL